MNYNPKARLFSFIFAVIIGVIAVNVFNASNYPAKKDKLLIEFARGIAFNDCKMSQNAYDDIIKIDPEEKYIFQYYDLIEHILADLKNENLKQILNMCYASNVSKNAKDILIEALTYQNDNIDKSLIQALQKN